MITTALDREHALLATISSLSKIYFYFSVFGEERYNQYQWDFQK